MKKKLSLLVIAILMFSLIFTGCSNKIEPLENVGGEVVASTNGTAYVEKGDYVYFINGIANLDDNNEFGEVTKGALVRVNKYDLNSISNPTINDDGDVVKSTAKIEVVIPKINLSVQFKNAVYFFGDYVYFATPSNKKNAAGTIKTSETEFYRFNLVKGEMDKKPIATMVDGTKEYMFTSKGDEVYLVYLVTETDENQESGKNFFKVVNANTGKEVFTSPSYLSIALPEDSSNTIFYTINSYSKELDEDANEKFDDIYSYSIGDEDAVIRLSGAGNYAKNRGDRIDDEGNEVVPMMLSIAGNEGFTASLIKNTGKFLIYSLTKLDSENPAVIYYGAEYNTESGVIENLKEENVVCFGYGNDEFNPLVLTESAYYKSLNEIYYVDSTYGFCVFDYTKDTNKRVKPVGRDWKTYSLFKVDGNVMYFSDGNGVLYETDISVTEPKLYKLNGVAMALGDTFYKPTIVKVNETIDGATVEKKYLIGVYTAEYCYNYNYCVDITNAMEEPLEGETESNYVKGLNDLASMDATKTNLINATLVGIMLDTDLESYNNYLEATYVEE